MELLNLRSNSSMYKLTGLLISLRVTIDQEYDSKVIKIISTERICKYFRFFDIP